MLWSIFGLTSLVSVGTSAMLARRIGEGDLPKADYIAALRIGHTVEGISFFLALGFSIATATCLGQASPSGLPAQDGLQLVS